MELERFPFNLLSAVEESISIVARAAFEKGLDLHMLLESDMPVSYSSQIEGLMLFDELLGNSSR